MFRFFHFNFCLTFWLNLVWNNRLTHVFICFTFYFTIYIKWIKKAKNLHFFFIVYIYNRNGYFQQIKLDGHKDYMLIFKRNCAIWRCSVETAAKNDVRLCYVNKCTWSFVSISGIWVMGIYKNRFYFTFVAFTQSLYGRITCEKI